MPLANQRNLDPYHPLWTLRHPTGGPRAPASKRRPFARERQAAPCPQQRPCGRLRVEIRV